MADKHVWREIVGSGVRARLATNDMAWKLQVRHVTNRDHIRVSDDLFLTARQATPRNPAIEWTKFGLAVLYKVLAVRGVILCVLASIVCM